MKYRIRRIYMDGSVYAFERNRLSLFQVFAGRPGESGSNDYPYNRRQLHIP